MSSIYLINHLRYFRTMFYEVQDHDTWIEIHQKVFTDFDIQTIFGYCRNCHLIIEQIYSSYEGNAVIQIKPN